MENQNRKELWKDIEGYEGLYQVSSFGKIKSIQRLVKNRGEILNLRKERLLKSAISRCYLVVVLCNNTKKTTYTVHRLVAKTFIPNPENKPQVNHINGIKTDNRLENLEWNTCSENTSHSYKNKLQVASSGFNHYSCKLDKDQVLMIREKYFKQKISQQKIAKEFSISQNAVSRIINLKTFKI